MFDELVAKPLALMRGRHVEELILKLNNKRAVIKRGRKIFELDHYPIVDTEILELKNTLWSGNISKNCLTNC